ncbi:IS701 family transposase [Aneurinibacillus sp. XH2]|uniref:IS701 family transposase n=2 Tax=Aneurinibacillus TaxID=55079 RepID=UPI00215010B0|nr:IS701 family transposase [Aneurinibacillus sp. XH2]
MDGVMTRGFSGTLTDIHREGCHSRNQRTLSHFLSHGKWDENYLMRIIQEKTWKMIRQEAKRTEEPIFIIIDDTICEKKKPSSQAMLSIQGTGFHYSHTKGKQVWGYEMVQQVLRCGDCVIPYDFKRYESKKQSKIQLACELVANLPRCSQKKYLLIDTWYPAKSVLETAAQSGCHVISGLKTNRIFYPQGIRQSLKEFANHIRESDTDLVTVGHTSYRVYRYEGKLNMVENAVVLLCWDAAESLTLKNMRAFLSTDISLSSEQILSYYSKRWVIETYFRTIKGNFSFDRYQVRSTKAIHRFWTLLSFTAAFCILTGHATLLDGLQRWRVKKAKAGLNLSIGQQEQESRWILFKNSCKLHRESFVSL